MGARSEASTTEAAATPLTYLFVGWLKRQEGVDHYDYGVNYYPFSRK